MPYCRRGRLSDAGTFAEHVHHREKSARRPLGCGGADACAPRRHRHGTFTSFAASTLSVSSFVREIDGESRREVALSDFPRTRSQRPHGFSVGAWMTSSVVSSVSPKRCDSARSPSALAGTGNGPDSCSPASWRSRCRTRLHDCSRGPSLGAGLESANVASSAPTEQHSPGLACLATCRWRVYEALPGSAAAVQVVRPTERWCRISTRSVPAPRMSRAYHGLDARGCLQHRVTMSLAAATAAHRPRRAPRMPRCSSSRSAAMSNTSGGVVLRTSSTPWVGHCQDRLNPSVATSEPLRRT